MHQVLFTLCMFGFNFYKRFILFCHEFDRREIAWNIYSMIILLLIVTKVSRRIGIFQTQVHGMVIFVYSLATVWCVQRLAHFIACFIDSTMWSKFRKFVTSYQEYIDMYMKGEPAVKNSAYVFAAIFWILVLSLTTLDAYCHHLHGEDNIFWPFEKGTYFTVAVDVMNTIAITCLYAIWFGIALITCYCLMHKYEIINVEINLYGQDSGALFQQVESFLLCHLQVSRLINKFDGFFSLHPTVDVTCTLSMSFLQLYGIIWDTFLRKDVAAILTALLWVCMVFRRVLVEIYSASLLNEAVSG